MPGLDNDGYSRGSAPASQDWLDENKILVTTQHFIQVMFYVEPNAKNSEAIKDLVYTDAQDRHMIVLSKQYIKSAEFDGVQIGARSGKISLTDPEGRWALAMEYVGIWANSRNNTGKPNMIIKFGWVGLHGQESSKLTNVPATLLKTGFSVTDDGTVNINLEFVENSENALESIRFNTLGDLTRFNSETNGDLKNKSIDEILTFIAASESIKTQLDRYNVEIIFDQTHEPPESRFGEDGKEFKVRFGDSFGDKIRELISHAMPSNPNDPDFTWSYQKIRKTIYENNDANSPKYKTIIRYGWIKAPKPGSSNINKTDMPAAMVSGGETPIYGPTLLWKKKVVGNEYKELISFELDLKMMDFVAHLMRDELSSKLSEFADKDWDNLAAAVDNMDGDSEGLKSLPLNELRESILNNEKSFLSGMSYGGIISKYFGNAREINNTTVEFVEALKKANNNVDKQIKTIIKNNSFKASARFMGDPTFGTKYLPYKVIFKTDFSAVSEFVSFFSLVWRLTKVTHKIEEGGYFTDIELQSWPEDNK